MQKSSGIIKRMLIRGALLGLGFVVVSLFWKRFDVFLGVLLGVLIAYGDFWLMCILSRIVTEYRSKSFFWVVQGLKYLFIAFVLAVLFVKKVVNPLAVVFGLSLLMLIPFTDIKGLKNV